MKKPFGFSSAIAVMVVSDDSSALRCSFSPVSRDVCGEVVCEFEPPRLIVMLTVSVLSTSVTKQTGDMVYTMAENSWLS